MTGGPSARGEDAASVRLARVAEIEAELDPSRRRRGRVVADLITVAIVAPIAIAFDFHVTRPFVLLALMGGALALNHLVPRLTQRRMREERNRLLEGSKRLPPGSEH